MSSGARSDTVPARAPSHVFPNDFAVPLRDPTRFLVSARLSFPILFWRLASRTSFIALKPRTRDIHFRYGSARTGSKVVFRKLRVSRRACSVLDTSESFSGTNIDSGDRAPRS